MYFLTHYLLSYCRYGARDKSIFTVRMVSYDQIFDFFYFFIKDVFVFVWRINRPNINNDVVGVFLDLGLNKTLNLLFLCLEKMAPLSSYYLRVSLPSNLVSLSPLLLMKYLFSIRLTVWVVRFLMHLIVIHCF